MNATDPSGVTIHPADGPDDMAVARTLFMEYQDWLGEDLCFQDFQSELASLPGKYRPPRGVILLARDGDAVAGCVAMWPLETGVCEMKRMYLREAWRGTGLGRRLAEAVVDAGRQAGYRAMRLDTLSRLTAAVTLYRSMGFKTISPYYANPLSGVMYMEKRLDEPS
ncbi:MAG: GNAT family N-acetyltransferase [Rhodobacterales bacterium]|nr:GNAT family N-acetyltransferase [Rhodobacterales bacterium]